MPPLSEETRAKLVKKLEWSDGILRSALEAARRWTGLRFCQRNFRDEPLRTVEMAAKNPVAGAGKGLPEAIVSLIWWHHWEGTRLVLEKDPAGWPAMRVFWRLCALFGELQQSQTATVERFLGLSPSAGQAKCLWTPSFNYMAVAILGLIATREDGPVMPLADHVHEFTERLRVSVNPLPLVLAWRLHGQRADRPIWGLAHHSVSKRVIEAWETDDTLEEHIWTYLIGLTHGGLLPSSDFRLCHANHLTIAAVKRVREVEGRGWFLPDHPAAQTPLNRVPDRIEGDLPDWFQDLSAALRNIQD